MAICPKCGYEYEEKAEVVSDTRKYALDITPVCCKCDCSFKACAYWCEQIGYVCEECAKDGTE